MNMDRLTRWYSDMLETSKEQEDLIEVIKAIPSAESQDSEDKIIRRTLENFMRGLWEEIQVGELEYTTSEVYEMLEREIFTDNHVAVSSAERMNDKTRKWGGDHSGYNTMMLYEIQDVIESQPPI